MNWVEIVKGGIFALLVAIGVWFWRDQVWEERLKNAPTVRDTVVVKADPLPPVVISAPAVLTPEPRIDTLILHVENKDSLIRDLAQVATLDTAIVQGENRVDLALRYVPLDHRFDIEASFPPYKHTIITNTKTVYNKPEWWRYGILGASSLLIGWGVADEDAWKVGGGVLGVVAISVTL